MKVQMALELWPFEVPDSVHTRPSAGRRASGLPGSQSFPLSDLDTDTLERMCDQFRKAVFEKAGRRLPPGADILR